MADDIPGFEDETQDEFIPRKKAKGDIRDLYAYYRFSDHALTVIKLKEKSLKKEEVWFEGHMNWTFVSCVFQEPFHFGVSGDRLEEDTRGTEENPEPMPPYGHNAVRFEGCEFNSPFDIKKDSIAIFLNCDINSGVENLVLDDSVKAEFINCNIESKISIKNYSQVKFRDCNFSQTSSSFIEMENHSTVKINNCNPNGIAQEDWVYAENDCEVIIYSCPSTFRAQRNVVHVVENSLAKIYSCSGLEATQGSALKGEDNSKIEVRDIVNILSTQENAVNLNDSQLYSSECNVFSSSTSQAINAVSSDIRLKDTITIESSQSQAINLIYGTFYGLNINEIVSQQNKAVQAFQTDIVLDNISSINAPMDDAVSVEGSSKLVLKRSGTVSSEQGDGIVSRNGVQVYIDNVNTIESQQGVAIRCSVDSLIDVKDCTLIDGQLWGIYGEDSTVTVSHVTSVESPGGKGVHLIDCSVDINNSVVSATADHAIRLENCKGVLYSLSATSQQGDGLKINSCSGNFEITGVSNFSSQSSYGVYLLGDLRNIRLQDIENISSQDSSAFVIDATSGNIIVKDINTISTNSGDALQVSLSSANLTLSTFTQVSSESGQALSCSVTNSSKVIIENLDEITSSEDVALNVSGNSSEIVIRSIGDITSNESTALNIAGSDSEILVRDINSLASDKGKALYTELTSSKCKIDDVISIFSKENTAVDMVLSSCSVIFSDIEDIESEDGKGWAINASNSFFKGDKINSIVSEKDNALDIEYASGELKLSGLPTIVSTEGTGVNVSVSSNGKVHFAKIGDISSTEGTALNLSIVEGSEFKLDSFSTIESVESYGLTGNCYGTAIIANGQLIKSGEQRSVSMSVPGVEGFFKIVNVDSILTEEGRTALNLPNTVGYAEINNVSTITGEDSVYGIYVSGNPQTGICRLYDCPNISISGGSAFVIVYPTNLKEFTAECFKEKGSISSTDASYSGVFAYGAPVKFKNYSEIKVEKSGTTGVFIFNSARNDALVEFIDVDTIEGGENGTGANIINGYKTAIIRVGEIKSEGNGLLCSGDQSILIDGLPSSPTEFSGKDDNSQALSCLGTSKKPKIEITHAKTLVGKGKTNFSDRTIEVLNTEINGALTTNNTVGRITSSKVTSGWGCTNSPEIDVNESMLQIGTNSGSPDNWSVSSSKINVYKSNVSGSKDQSFTDSDIFFFNGTFGSGSLTLTGCTASFLNYNVNCPLTCTDSILNTSLNTLQSSVTVTSCVVNHFKALFYTTVDATDSVLNGNLGEYTQTLTLDGSVINENKVSFGSDIDAANSVLSLNDFYVNGIATINGHVGYFKYGDFNSNVTFRDGVYCGDNTTLAAIDAQDSGQFGAGTVLSLNLFTSSDIQLATVNHLTNGSVAGGIFGGNNSTLHNIEISGVSTFNPYSSILGSVLDMTGKVTIGDFSSAIFQTSGFGEIELGDNSVLSTSGGWATGTVTLGDRVSIRSQGDSYTGNLICSGGNIETAISAQNSQFQSITLNENSSLILERTKIFGTLTTGFESAVLGNESTVFNVDMGNTSGIILNSGEMVSSESVTLGNTSGVILNGVLTGPSSLELGEEAAVLCNSVPMTGISVGQKSGVILNSSDKTGALGITGNGFGLLSLGSAVGDFGLSGGTSRAALILGSSGGNWDVGVSNALASLGSSNSGTSILGNNSGYLGVGNSVNSLTLDESSAGILAKTIVSGAVSLGEGSSVISGSSSAGSWANEDASAAILGANNSGEISSGANWGLVLAHHTGDVIVGATSGLISSGDVDSFISGNNSGIVAARGNQDSRYAALGFNSGVGIISAASEHIEFSDTPSSGVINAAGDIVFTGSGLSGHIGAGGTAEIVGGDGKTGSVFAGGSTTKFTASYRDGLIRAGGEDTLVGVGDSSDGLGGHDSGVIVAGGVQGAINFDPSSSDDNYNLIYCGGGWTSASCTTDKANAICVQSSFPTVTWLGNLLAVGPDSPPSGEGVAAIIGHGSPSLTVPIGIKTGFWIGDSKIGMYTGYGSDGLVYQSNIHMRRFTSNITDHSLVGSIYHITGIGGGGA